MSLLSTKKIYPLFYLFVFLLTPYLQSHSPLPIDFPLPPCHIQGYQTFDQFMTHYDLTNVITWSHPLAGNRPIYYEIYRDSDLKQLVKRLPAHGSLKFKECRLEKHKTYHYYIYSVDAKGTRSSPAKIIFKKNSETQVIPPPTLLKSLVILPEKTCITVNDSLSLQATGIFSDGTAQDITYQVEWKSSNSSVAVIHSKGLSIGVGCGEVFISANFKGIENSVPITIKPPPATLLSLEIILEHPSMIIGDTQPIIAIATFSDGSKIDVTSDISWSCMQTVANIDSNGTIQAVGSGTTWIFANLDEVVSFAILKVDPQI